MAKRRAHPDIAEASRLTETQVQALVAHVRQQADQARCSGGSRAVVDEVIVLILLHAGLRPQELRALRIADTPAHHGKPQLNVAHNSGVAGRAVSIPHELIPVFERFVRLHRAGAQPGEPLLLSERSTPFSYMSLYSKLRRIGQDAGLPALHPAMLRHTFLVRLYEKERDLRLVQEQAGHARLKSTARHVRPRRPAQRCEACGKSLSPDIGKKIDSGQLLCPACMKELCRH